MINELKVNCFLHLAETLNFTESGKLLYISQQAVSRHIASLEADIGARLFSRTRNSVELTDVGIKLYHFFRDTATGYNLILAEIRAANPTHTKNIRIGYQNWLELAPTLSSALNKLREKIPELCLLGERRSPVVLISLLKGGALDMILMHERFTSGTGGFQKLLLIETPMQIVVSKSDPLCGIGTDYRVFANHALLIDAFEGESPTITTERAQRELQPYGFSPKEIIVVPNRDSVYIEAELGRGVFYSTSMAQGLHSDMLVRYDTDVMEGLYCIWKDVDNGFISQYAKQLKTEYGTD